MKNSLKILILLFILILPFNTYAISNEYEDVVHDITGHIPSEDKITFYYCSTRRGNQSCRRPPRRWNFYFNLR